MTTATATVCTWCGEELDDEEAESPRLDDADKVICDDCYRDEYEYTCHWCEESEDMEHHCEVGSLFVLYESVDAQPPHSRKPWYSQKRYKMRPGIYRITRWPMYYDGIIEGGLYAWAFEWFGPLPEKWEDRSDGYYPCGPLCRSCQRKIKHAKWRPGGIKNM